MTTALRGMIESGIGSWYMNLNVSFGGGTSKGVARSTITESRPLAFITFRWAFTDVKYCAFEAVGAKPTARIPARRSEVKQGEFFMLFSISTKAKLVVKALSYSGAEVY